MHNVVDSSSFQDLESRSNLDLKDVLQKAYGKYAASTSVDQSKNNAQELKKVLQQLLSHNVSNMD